MNGDSILHTIPLRNDGGLTLCIVIADSAGNVDVRKIGDVIVSPPTAATARLRMQTLGDERIWVDGEDVTTSLSAKPIRRFAFLYLLSRALWRPDDRYPRSNFADEVYPGVDPKVKGNNTRQLPFRLRHLPFGSCVQADDERAWIDLSGCEVDALRLLELAHQVQAADLPLPPATLRDVEATLRDSDGEYLPEWENVEERITGRRGNAGEVVAAVRARLESAHVALLMALADSCSDRAAVARTIPRLSAGLSRFPAQEEIARRLIDAYEQTGRTGAAARLRTEYGLSKAS